MSEWLRLYLDVVVFVFGACVGSFLNVCIHRVPREQSIVNPRSRCPQCGTPISWRDNIPLLSFLLLRGKCRHCGRPISPRYFLVELLTASLFAAVWMRFSFTLAVAHWILLAGLIVATFVDFEHYIIPNEITYGGVLVGLALSALIPELMGVGERGRAVLLSLAGVGLGGGMLFVIAILGEKIFKKEAMGMGDVKLLAAIGAFVGWQGTIFTLLISSVVGGLVGLLLVALRQKQWQSRIPYGPYIALGAVVWVFWGRQIVNWYLNFLRSAG
jgi:leader peptidase (prepilin peptidase)/N-methyltransferase